MKSLLTILLSILVLAGFSQTIHYVDNTASSPGGALVYTQLQAAIDSAVAGDIIHVRGSATSYGNVVVDKQLEIFGIGINPDKDIPLYSALAQIDLNQGSSGTRLSGLRITGSIQLAQVSASYSLSNISIENCNVNFIYVSQQCCTNRNVDNLILRNSVIANLNNGGNQPYIDFVSPYGNVTNAVITNNIILGYTGTTGALEAIGALVKNNLFVGNADGENAFGNLSNSTVANNIFYGRAPASNGSLSNVVFSNNLSFQTGADSLPAIGSGITGSGNLQGVDPEMTNIATGNNVVIASIDITPLGTSPLLGAGTDGTNIGPTGSTIPWDNTGVPLPIIQQLNVTEVIKQGDNLEINVKARGN